MKYIIIAVLIAGGVAAGGTKAVLGGEKCTVRGSGVLVAPDDGCTPGAYFERKDPCAHRDRKRYNRPEIIRAYGLDPREFKGEVDHRIPHFLGGKDTLENLWPEAGRIPNAKDKLEFYIYDRVCDSRDMPYEVAVAIFEGDWRVAYRDHKEELARISLVRGKLKQ